MTTGYRNEIWHTYLETQTSSFVLEQWKIDAGILDLYVQTKDMENCKNEKVWGFFGGGGGGSSFVCLFPPPPQPFHLCPLLSVENHRIILKSICGIT